MKVTFICGYCKKKSHKMPELNRLGDKAKCPKCQKWQTFNGTMEILKPKGL